MFKNISETKSNIFTTFNLIGLKFEICLQINKFFNTEKKLNFNNHYTNSLKFKMTKNTLPFFYFHQNVTCKNICVKFKNFISRYSGDIN